MKEKNNILSMKKEIASNNLSDIKLIVDKKLDFYSDLCQKNIHLYSKK